MWWWVAALAATSAAGFAAGGLARKRRLEAFKAKLFGANTFAQSMALMRAPSSGKLKFPGFRPATGPAADLKRALEAWAILVDTMLETYGAQAADAYRVAVRSPTENANAKTVAVCRDAGLVLFAYRTVPAGAAAKERRKAWDASPATVVERAEKMFECALHIGAVLEEHAGTPITLGKPGGPSLGTMIEDYATDAAIGYLVGAVPGGAAVLAIGEALGGPGWNYGMGTTSSSEPNDLETNWEAYRAVALEAAADLLAYALESS